MSTKTLISGSTRVARWKYTRPERRRKIGGSLKRKNQLDRQAALTYATFARLDFCP